MIYKNHLSLKVIITFFLSIIPFIFATDCDVFKNFLSYTKGDLSDEIMQYDNCCDAESILTCDSLNYITRM